MKNKPLKRPIYTAKELDIAARIIDTEIGTGAYVRPLDNKKLKDAATALAWTMRNRLEVGEPLVNPQGTPYHGGKAKDYTSIFQYYTDKMPSSPDPTVLQEVKDVFNAPDRSGDPLKGAIFVINRERYIKLQQQGFSDSPTYRVEWDFGTPTPNKTSSNGVYFFLNQPPLPQ